MSSMIEERTKKKEIGKEIICHSLRNVVYRSLDDNVCDDSR